MFDFDDAAPALVIEQELRAEFAFGKCAKKERREERGRSNLVCIECGLCGEAAGLWGAANQESLAEREG